jgi:hypothetical protein
MVVGCGMTNGDLLQTSVGGLQFDVLPSIVWFPPPGCESFTPKVFLMLKPSGRYTQLCSTKQTFFNTGKSRSPGHVQYSQFVHPHIHNLFFRIIPMVFTIVISIHMSTFRRTSNIKATSKLNIFWCTTRV